MTTPFEQVLQAYIKCALWSSNDDDDTPLDSNYTASDIDAETLAAMRKDCQAFIDACDAADIPWRDCPNFDTAPYDGLFAHFGYDFWLTRNGHGAGFWDGDWIVGMDDIGDELTKIAEKFGEVYLYIGDDGLVCSN